MGVCIKCGKPCEGENSLCPECAATKRKMTVNRKKFTSSKSVSSDKIENVVQNDPAPAQNIPPVVPIVPPVVPNEPPVVQNDPAPVVAASTIPAVIAENTGTADTVGSSTIINVNTNSKGKVKVTGAAKKKGSANLIAGLLFVIAVLLLTLAQSTPSGKKEDVQVAEQPAVEEAQQEEADTPEAETEEAESEEEALSAEELAKVEAAIAYTDEVTHAIAKRANSDSYKVQTKDDYVLHYFEGHLVLVEANKAYVGYTREYSYDDDGALVEIDAWKSGEQDRMYVDNTGIIVCWEDHDHNRLMLADTDEYNKWYEFRDEGIDLYTQYCVMENGEYIIPDSDTRLLTDKDLDKLTQWEVRLARNEICARYGRKFNNPDIQAHFDACSWYKPTMEASVFDKKMESLLNSTELKNCNFILDYEKRHNYN